MAYYPHPIGTTQGRVAFRRMVIMLWRYAEGCGLCEEAKKLPRPLPSWTLWLGQLVLSSVWLAALYGLQPILATNFRFLMGFSVVLGLLSTGLLFFVLSKAYPELVGGHQLTISFAKGLGGELLLHTHKRGQGPSASAAYLEEVPVLPAGKSGSFVRIVVRGDMRKPGWSVVMPPTGKAIDVRLIHVAQHPLHLPAHECGLDCDSISFSSWGDLLYAACTYSSIDEMLGSQQLAQQQRSKSDLECERLQGLLKSERSRNNYLKDAIRESVAHVSGCVGEKVNIPVDVEDPVGRLFEMDTAVEIYCRSIASTVAALVLNKERDETALIEAVARLAKAFQIEFQGEYTLPMKLTHASLHAEELAELMHEQRRKLTLVTSRMIEAEQLTQTLGQAIMELRFWMAEDVQIRSQLFAKVRRFFQEIVTPQVRECAPQRDYLREWYEEARKADGHSLVNHLEQKQLYRGDFDDILGAPPISHKGIPSRERGRSMHTRRRF